MQAWNCSTEYGNPSGHTFVAVGLLYTVWLDLDNHGVLFRLCVLFVFTGMEAITAFSRVYLGAHSIN